MPMFVSIFWMILLLFNKRQNYAKRYLTFFFFISTLNYFVHVLFFTKEYELFAFWDNIWFFTSLSVYPLYYYYIKLLTVDEKTDIKNWWMLLPAILLSLFSFVLYYLMSPEEISNYIRSTQYHEFELYDPYSNLVRLQLIKSNMFKIVFTVQLVLVVYFGRNLIVKYNKKVTEFYSNTEGKNLTVISLLLYVFIFSSVISLLSCIVGKDFFVNQGWLLLVPSITHSISLFAVGYVGYYQNFTIVEFNRDLEASNKIDDYEQDDDLVSDVSVARLSRSLKNLMLEEQLFRNPELRISDVVVLLGSNRTYVSQLINDEKKMNFCEWINSYRVEYAKSLIEKSTESNLTMINISEMSGFSSRSVFYRVFKEKYGMSPGAYKQQSLSLTNQSEK